MADFDPAEYSKGFNPAEFARGGAPAVDVGPEARRARAGMAPSPSSQDTEAETGAGGPIIKRSPNYMDGREKTPYEKSSIDPTAQMIAENMVLGGAGHLVGGMLGRAVANTRGAKAAEMLAEAQGPLDPAAEKATEALRFKLLPDKEHIVHTMAAGGAGTYFHHPLMGILGDLALRNAVPIEGALARGAATKLLPPALVAGRGGVE
jgi:hypothetical protein